MYETNAPIKSPLFGYTSIFWPLHIKRVTYNGNNWSFTLISIIKSWSGCPKLIAESRLEWLPMSIELPVWGILKIWSHPKGRIDITESNLCRQATLRVDEAGHIQRFDIYKAINHLLNTAYICEQLQQSLSCTLTYIFTTTSVKSCTQIGSTNTRITRRQCSVIDGYNSSSPQRNHKFHYDLSKST